MRVIERFCQSKISEVERKGTHPVLGRAIKQEEEKVNDCSFILHLCFATSLH